MNSRKHSGNASSRSPLVPHSPPHEARQRRDQREPLQGGRRGQETHPVEQQRCPDGKCAARIIAHRRQPTGTLAEQPVGDHGHQEAVAVVIQARPDLRHGQQGRGEYQGESRDQGDFPGARAHAMLIGGSGVQRRSRVIPNPIAPLAASSGDRKLRWGSPLRFQHSQLEASGYAARPAIRSPVPRRGSQSKPGRFANCRIGWSS